MFASLLSFTFADAAIEFIGALIIVAYVIAALITLVRSGSIVQARLVAADGVITGLSFKLAGTLLKTLLIHTWSQILIFVIIFALRTILKRLFMWEKARLTVTRAQ